MPRSQSPLISASAPSASITFGPITVFELAEGVSAEAVDGKAAASADRSSAAERISAENGLESAFMEHTSLPLIPPAEAGARTGLPLRGTRLQEG